MQVEFDNYYKAACLKSRLSLYMVFMLACLLSGCEPNEPYTEAIPASAQRTVLLYLGVDNNFRPEAQQKIETLTTNWNKNTDGNLLVYADDGDRPALIHIYHSKPKGNVADTLTIYPPENSANPQTFTRVLNDVKAYRPAQSYGLIVLSHATGWLPAEMSYPTPVLRSVILDNGTSESNNYMELSDFAAAIPYKLDFIIFDACFMGAVEVCYELKDKADYIVASPAEVVSPGFVYASVMQHLFAPQADLVSVAREFYEYYNNRSGLYRSATVSVVKTAGLDAVAAIFKGVAGQARNDNMLQNLQCFGYGTQKIYFDLGDYVQQLLPEQYTDFQTALDNCVVYKAHTDSYYSAGKPNTLTPIRAFSGMSVYVPQAGYPVANEAYKKLKWAKRME
ncbi:clostripain [Bacteroidia bacterium]|nr:clostripain [Bacteroidia bacterium]